nr:UDP-N-acetylmuramoyl-tripeptide--D-alanyl-D-alanine ligase [uncultured bacterium]
MKIRSLTLSDILFALVGKVETHRNFKIEGGCVDSRRVKANNLFIALPGETTDGHLYVDTALRNGAVLAVIDHLIVSDFPIVDLSRSPLEIPESGPFSLLTSNSLGALQKIATWWRAQLDLKVIGITGSVGKSSTKELTASVLSRRFVTLRSEGNQNNEIGLPLNLLDLTSQHEVAVLEMGFYVPGEIKLLCDIAKPQIGIITNVGTVHAERAGSIEIIAKGKSELVEALPPAPTGVAILNYDDPLVRQMATKTNATIFTYGLSPEADLWADEIESMGLEGVRCQMHYQGESNFLTAPLIGRHSVYTMLRAAATALILGISWDWIFFALKDTTIQVRIVTVSTQSGARIIDDSYNASPDSTIAALNLLNDLGGRKVAVLGDMLELGQYENEGHQKVGWRASEVADELILIGERSTITREAALSSGCRPEKIHWYADASSAIPYLKENLTSGDMVLVKGSHSMHMETIVAALEENQ